MPNAKASFTDSLGMSYDIRADSDARLAAIDLAYDASLSRSRIINEKDAPRVASMILSAYLNASVEELADKRARLRVGEGFNSAHYLVPTNDATAEHLLNTALCALLAYNGYTTHKEEEAAAEAAEELDAEALAYYQAYFGDPEMTLDELREDITELEDFRDVARAARKLLGRTTK